MDLPDTYGEKFRPRARKTGEPRNERDELIDLFRARLNASRIHDGYSKVTNARVATMLKGWSNEALHQLYKQCDDPSVRSFGAMLTFKLRAG